MFEGFEEGNFVEVGSRRLRSMTCKKYGLRAFQDVDDERYLIFDYHDAKGNICAQHSYHVSHWDKRFFWKGVPQAAQLYGQNLWQGGGKRLVITKGEIDACTIAQAFNLKWATVAVSGYRFALNQVRRNYEWIDSFGDIVLAFDNTEAGIQATEEIATMFSPGKVRVMGYDGYDDANHMLMENAGEKIAIQVFNAKTFRPDGIVFGDELWDSILEDPPTGYEIPFPELQSKLQGMRKGRIFLFTAGSGLGKSTLAHEIGYHLYKEHGQKLGCMALEEPKKRLAERYLSIRLNKQIHVNREGVTDEQLKEAYDATINNRNFCLYDHRGSKDIKTLLAKIRFMVVALGMDWVILDHISIVVSGTEEVNESERKTIDRLMTGLSSMVEELDFGMIAIVHLKRTGDNKSYNEGRPVTLSDLRGSGGIEHMSHVVISLERNQQDEEVKHFSQLRLLKDRDLGDTGVADVLQYFPDSGRLKAADNNPFEKVEGFEAKGDF